LVVKSVLANFGIVPDIVGNGLEAVQALRYRPYDVVLMDVHMPEMDGLAATKAIRALNGRESRLPIVALTANAFAKDMEECAAAGMNAHVGKPFRTDELLVALGDALTGRSRFAAPASPAVSCDGAQPVLDWPVIERFRADSGEEMLRLLIDTYVAEAGEKLGRLSRLAGDTSAVADVIRLAHSLKSGSAMAGAAALSQLAAHLERSLDQQSEVDAAGTVRAMQDQFARYKSALIARGLAA
jgi:CheY-like chemotaxis protein/HPt (histidine-containing phosphotransfer) domain-containing protein